MAFSLILHFMLNGHVHTVNSGRAFSSQQECRSAGEQERGNADRLAARLLSRAAGPFGFSFSRPGKQSVSFGGPALTQPWPWIRFGCKRGHKASY